MSKIIEIKDFSENISNINTRVDDMSATELEALTNSINVLNGLLEVDQQIDTMNTDIQDLKQNGVSQDNINSAVEEYLTNNPVQSGATTEQVAQIEANKNNISTINDIIGSETMETSSRTIKGSINELKRTLENIDGTGSIPEYSVSDANKILSVNSNGTSLEWIDTSIGGSDIIFRDVTDGEVFSVSKSEEVTTYGDIITSVSALSINEGEEDEITVKLSTAPTVDQQVSISVNNGNCTVDKSSLTFTPSNFNNTQIVKVRGTHNSTDYTNLTSIISLSSTGVETKEINVTILNIDSTNPITSISAVYTQGDTTVYPDTLLNDLKSNLVVTAHYSNSSSETVTGYVLSGTLTEGTSTITVTYQGKTATFDVTVTARPTLDSISAVYTQGDKKVYTTSSLDSLKDNLVVTAHYSNSSTQTVTGYALSGTLIEGTSTITVTYREKTTTFNVTVTASETPVLTSITSEFNQGYSKVYTISSVNSLKNNLVVTAHYNDDSTQTVTDYVLSGTLTEGTSTITVTYEDKTDTFDVNVEVLEINENSNAYIKDGYLYLDTASMNRAGIIFRNNETTPDLNHQYFNFYPYANCGYSVDKITDEIAERIHNNVIEFAGNGFLTDFSSGKMECADFAYMKYNNSLYYRIPTSAYEAAGNDIINALANVIPKFPTLINPNKTLTIYTITDEIIDSITKGTVFDTATVEGESHTGFLTLNPNISGIKENLSCITSLGGVYGSKTLKVPMDIWYTNVNGSRLNYSIPYGKIPGNTVDDIKAYLKANRLIFYKFD